MAHRSVSQPHSQAHWCLLCLGYKLKRPGVQPSMIGASYCCHVTLLILLLAPRIAFANINTPLTPSSSSLSPSSPAESPSLATSQSPSATTIVSSSSRTLLPHFEPSSSDTNNSPSQSNSFSLSSDQSNHNTPEEASPTPVNSQLSGTSINNVQSDSSFQSNETPSSIVMKRTSLTNSANVQQEPQSDNNSPLQKREQFKLSAKNKNMLTAFEQLFLKKNGLEKKPQFSSEYAVPEYMLDLYNVQTHISRKRSKYLKLKGNGDIAANTVRSFVHTDADSSTCHPPLCSRVHFDISGIPDAESLTGAELRIYLASKADFQATGTGQSPDPSLGAVQIINTSTSVDDGASYRVEVHEVMRPESEAGDAITRLIDTQVISSQGNSTWQSFDIRPAVLKWRREDKHNHGLEIRLVRKTPGVSHSSLSTDNHVRIRRSVHLPDRDWALQRPLLVAFTDDGTSASSSKPIRLTRLKRNRRQVSDEDNKKLHKKGKKDKKKKKKRKKKGNKNICQRHGLYVNFNDVGWDDWIVAPSGYSAFYCHGDCMAPLPHFTKASNHAMLQARVYKVNPGSVPMVCCVPSKMSSISMLYRDEKGRTVLKNYQDMSVDECSCK